MDQSQQEATWKGTKQNVEPINSNKFTKARIIKNLVLVSFTFLISFTASEGLSFLQSTMNKEVGVICFAVQYACGCIAALFLPKYLIQKYGSKLVLVVSMFAYVPYLSSNYYPVFGFMMPTSIIVGFASSLVFNSLATYVNDLASLYTELCLENECQNSNLVTSPHEKEILKNNLRDSPHFYNSIRKHKDSIFITKQSLFEDNGVSLNCANPTGKEIALIEFKHGSPLNEIASNKHTDKSQLLEGDFKQQEKKDILESKIKATLKKSYGALKNGINQSSSISDNINKSLSASGNESKLSGNEIIYDSSISGLSSVPEDGTKTRTLFENEQKDTYPTNFLASDKAIKMLETTTSRFFGFFGCVYQMCHILCNVITYVIFQKNSEQREYIRNSSCVCGSQFCSMESDCVLHNLEKPSTEARYTLTTVYVIMSFLSALITLLLLDKLNKKNDEVSFSLDIAIMTFKFHKNKSQLFLVPVSFYIGIVQAFITGDFTKDFIGCAWGVEHVSLVLISAGCAISLWSGLYGMLEKFAGRYIFFAIAASLNLAVNVTMLYWIPNSTEPATMFVVAAMWGTIIGILWCQIRAFIGLIFKEEEETAFGCYQLWHALGCAMAYAYNNYVCTYVKIYIMLTISTIAIIGYILAEKEYALSKKQRKAI